MEPILVPGPPKEAFKKLRLVSDLVKSQVKHFKHLEQKLPAAARATLPQHAIVTEDDAARYIAPMTAFLRSRVAPAAEVRAQPAPILLPTRISPPAASAPVGKPAAKRRTATGTKKSSAKSKAKPRRTREPK
jgi:hypothetical protein